VIGSVSGVETLVSGDKLGIWCRNPRQW
jgi:hypothetical protein